ncbi:MAG: excinuclease ABC subunit UvrC [Armatimonadota bacterium]
MNKQFQEHIEEKLRMLPTNSGCYIYRDEHEVVIYVGKAVNLRNRVRSYFQASVNHSNKTKRLVRKIADLEWIVTDTELEALVLECNLIKRYRPNYNIRLRDDKHYPFLVLTKSEAYPRLKLSRRVVQNGDRYFGPYSSSKTIYETINLLNGLFHVCTCGKEHNPTRPQKPCLFYHLGKCPAPCAGLADKDDYVQSVRGVERFLEGKTESVLVNLRERMETASDKLEFERAASLRDQITAVEQINERQKVLNTDMVDKDVLAFVSDNEQSLVQMFFIRNGKLIGQQHFMLEGAAEEEQNEALQEFVKQYYQQSQDIPSEIIMPAQVEEAHIIEQWLRQKQGHKVAMLVPQRGERKNLLDMAVTNARLTLEQEHDRYSKSHARQEAAMLALQARLKLPQLPRRIEAYDISTLQGHDSVGVMVVMKDAAPSRKDYRRFAIKMEHDAPNDYEMMREVLTRRFNEAKKNNPKFRELPDLLLIDGGKGQLGICMEVLAEQQLSIPALGLAKRFEEVFLPNQSEPVLIPKEAPELLMLMHVRDEAHRFSIEYNRKLRLKRSTSSALDEIEGVGPTRKRALIKHFRSVSKVRDAGVDQLIQCPGITQALAERIYEFFRT